MIVSQKISDKRCGSAFWMWVLLLLFVVRVAGQAIQYVFEFSFLPEASAFQGSELPYGALLAIQLLILLVMVRTAWRAQKGYLRASRDVGRALRWFGWIYLLGSAMRFAVGFLFESAHAWFHAWIPMVFHLVLAGFVLQVACYHLRKAGDAIPESSTL